MPRTPLLLLLTAVWTASAAFPQQPVNRPVGFTFGDGSYLIETDAIRGDGVLLEGEAVSTNVAPARVYLENSGFAILGVGSQVRVFEDRVQISGVSVEMLRFGSPALPLEAGGLEIAAATPDARLSVFTDRPTVVSVMVSRGEAEVSLEGGRVLRRMPAGSAATFTRTAGEIRIQEARAALEIARICMRQLELMAILEEYVPGVAQRRAGLVEMLSDASSGLLMPRQAQRDEVDSPEIPTGLPAIDPEKLITAAREVHFRLNQEGLDESGCGQPDCAAAEPPRWRNRFYGWAGGFTLPPPGCVLCQPGERTGPPESLQPPPEIRVAP
ncbi:MAG: hypothetical protein KDC27_01065 [Acidobacteria bacterium]|nr:hypothetical protein [Acidobacteriota bacterium]